ncbi:MAG: hypothetical protein JW729_09615, partial [Bacteroidales bacterium]|nr:hypothetical protein [Bacteroidales bacterium]
MSQEKSPIEKQIREKLLGMEVAPSDALWSGIEQSLQQRKKAALILYWRVGAAAAILLFALAISFFLFPNRQVQKTKESLAKQNSSDSILRQKDSTKVNKELPLQEIQLANDIRKQAIIPSESKQKSSQNNANISLQKQGVKIEPEFVFMDTISYVEIIPASIVELPFSKTVHPLEIEYSTNNLKEIRLIKSATYKQLLKYDEFAKLIADQQTKNQEPVWA